MASIVSSNTVTTTAPDLTERFRRLWTRRNTIRYLTSSNLKAGHRDKVLGHLWNLLDPMMFMLVYYFVFGVLFGLAGGGRSADFMLYILIGVLTFSFISGTVQQATMCVRGNRGLILEINFPKAVFPISVSLARLYDYLWGLIVLFLFLMIARVWPTVHYLWLPVLLAITVLFTTGAAMITAYLGTFFADTSNVVSVVLRLMFYCSPIFYFVRDEVRIEEVDGVVRTVVKHSAMFHTDLYRLIYMSNPIAALFECYRDALLWGRAPDPHLMGYTGALSIIIFLVGFSIFTRGEGRFAKYL